MEHEWMPATEAEFERQFREVASRQRHARSVKAVAVRYHAPENRVVIEFSNGCTFSFPPELAEGLDGAEPADLTDVRVLAGGQSLRWDHLDVDLSVHGLLRFVFGSLEWMRELGRLGGRVTSEAKGAAARRNGLKGGRPRRRSGSKFELKTNAGGEFFFTLRAASGEVVLTSQPYAARSGALDGIDSVRSSAANDRAFERRIGSAGQPFFVLKAANGRVIGRSDMYSSANSLERGISLVKENAPEAGVLDESS